MVKKQQPNAWMLTTIIFAALLVLSLVWNGVLTVMLIGGMGPTGSGEAPTQVRAPTPSAAPTAPAPSGAPVDVSVDDDPSIGTGEVVVIEFSDYECPFCARFHDDAYKQIKEEYIDTGLITFVYRDYPLSFHARATPAAIAAECVADLEGDEAYFDYHSALFESGDLSDANLQALAEAQGVNAADFADCYADEDGSKAAEVQADFADGQAAGVTGTPTLFIDGQKIVGAQPYSVFKQAIDAALEG